MLNWKRQFLQHFNESTGENIPIPEDDPLDLTLCRKKAAYYMDWKCSPVFGFQTKHCGINRFNIFESTFNLCLLGPAENATDAERIKTLARIINKNQRASGFWGYYIPKEKDMELAYFPDELEDSSLCLMALYLTNSISFYAGKAIAENILRKTKLDENGRVCIFLENEYYLNPLHEKIYQSYLENGQVDIGSAINFLWAISTYQMDAREELLPTVEFVDETIDQLIDTRGTNSLPDGMFYSTSRFTLYFLLSRYISWSAFAKLKFGAKLAKLVKEELIHYSLSDTHTALEISAILLAAMYLKLHVLKEVKDAELVRESIYILRDALLLQQLSTGAFPKWNCAGFSKYSGSKSITTVMAIATMDKLRKEGLHE